MNILKIKKRFIASLTLFRFAKLARDKSVYCCIFRSKNFIAFLLLAISTSSFSQQNEREEIVESVDETNLQDEFVDDQALEIEYEAQSIDALEPSKTPAQLSAQLRTNLESQFQQIQQLIKTEDAYSAKLGEEYLNYGLLLKRAGQLDEARDMIVDALHIAKVNEGVYSIEQRPILRALLETNLLLGKSEELVDNFEKIVWLENKTPSQIGNYSFDLAVKLGHHFFDRYKIQSVRSDLSLSLLDSAAKYFSYSIRQYGGASMSELIMPYGELSEVHFYRNRLLDRKNTLSGSSFSQRTSAFSRFDQLDSKKFTENTFSKTELYAKLHLQKAKSEENQEQIVAALLALGDANLLFRRQKPAEGYYQIAWEESLKLAPDNPLRQSFSKPVLLPAFNYAIEKEQPRRQGASYANISVNVSIDNKGKVTGIADSVVGATSNKVVSRARRTMKFSKFRPVIEDGKLQPSPQHTETIRVLVSK